MSNLALNIAVKAQNQTNAAMAQVAAAQSRVKLAVDQSRLAYDRYIQTMTSAKSTQAQMTIAADQVAIALDRVKVAEGGVAVAAERAKSSLQQTTGAMKGESAASHEGGFSLLEFASKLGMVVMGLQGAISMIRGLAESFIGLAQAIITPNAEMEQTTIAFQTLIPNIQQANAFLDDLWQFAARTPFQFPALAQASQMLLAFGMQLKNVKPLLTAIGDSLSALGRTSPAALNGLVAIFGKIQTQGRMMTIDMKELGNRGVNAWGILEKQMHLTHAQLQVMITKGLIPANKAIEMLRRGMEATFGGGMQKQAYTFNGLLTTFKDNIQLAFRNMTGPAFDTAKKVLVELNNLVSAKAFQQVARVIGQELAPAFRMLSGFVRDVIDKFRQWLSQKSTVDGLKTTISNLTVLLGSFASGFQSVVPATMQLLDAINGVNSASGKLAGNLDTNKSSMYNLGQGVGLLIGALVALGDATMQVVDIMIEVWNLFFADWGTRMLAMIDLYNALASAMGLPTIQKPGSAGILQEGGFTTGGAGGNRKFPGGSPGFGTGGDTGTGTGSGRGRGGVKTQQFTASDIADLLKNAREMHLKFNENLFKMLSASDKIKYLWQLVGQHMDKLDKLMAGTHGGLLAYLQWIITGKKPPGLILDNGASGTPGSGTGGSHTGKYSANFMIVNNITINAGTADAKQLYDLLLRRLERDLRRSGQISNNLSGGKAA